MPAILCLFCTVVPGRPSRFPRVAPPAGLPLPQGPSTLSPGLWVLHSRLSMRRFPFFPPSPPSAVSVLRFPARGRDLSPEQDPLAAGGRGLSAASVGSRASPTAAPVCPLHGRAGWRRQSDAAPAGLRCWAAFAPSRSGARGRWHGRGISGH